MIEFKAGDKVQWGSTNTITGTVLNCYEEDWYHNNNLTNHNICVVHVDDTEFPTENYQVQIGDEVRIPTSWLRNPVSNAINSKAKRLAVTNVYEKMTGQSGEPGRGPANLIRNMAGIKVPKGVRGGSKKTRKNRKNKKSRKNRK
jgi:hypothetical protein